MNYGISLEYITNRKKLNKMMGTCNFIKKNNE
jgi:hypothetical protein